MAETLREHRRTPTSETLLDYVKAMTVDEVLEAAEAQIGRCVQALKEKGVTLKRSAIAFDWHGRPYYGSPVTEEYARLFDMGVALPYETTYTCKDMPYRKMLEEADIAGFYRAFGMRPKGELPDHLVAELEYMALLYIKEGYALLSGDHTNATICREARMKFHAEHLSKWVEKFRSRVSQHAEKHLYPLLLELINLTIMSETQGQE